MNPALTTALRAILFNRLRGPAILWAVLVVVSVAARFTDLSLGQARFLDQAILVALVISATWVIVLVTGDIVQDRTQSADQLLKTPNLGTNLVRALVIILGALIVLQTLGIPVTPLVTALGVCGLAVSLALQDTMANLFAGIHLLAARQVRRGDYIRISAEEEGFVQDITWRYTTLRQPPNNIIIVPNARVASGTTANFNLPNTEHLVVVDVCVTSESDLEHVEKATEEVAAGVMHEVSGGCPDFRPYVRFHTIADTGIRFAVTLRCKHYVSQYLLKHEFIKRLHRRFSAEGIDFVGTTRTAVV